MNPPASTLVLETAEIDISDDPLWYRDAVIYQLNVKAFFDSNEDGMGDFKGVTTKLDYVKDLGVNTIWLMPFYPSPLRDDGYDISEYEDVHPQYGSLADFREMLAEAHKRGLRVITELVMNHTSSEHPWFQAARKAPPGSPERDFYVWSDNDQLLAYAKSTDDGLNVVVTVVNLDPHTVQSGWLHLDPGSIHVDYAQAFQMHDLVSDQRFLWQGHRHFVQLDPNGVPAHILRVRRRELDEHDFDHFF